MAYCPNCGVELLVNELDSGCSNCGALFDATSWRPLDKPSVLPVPARRNLRVSRAADAQPVNSPHPSAGAPLPNRNQDNMTVLIVLSVVLVLPLLLLISGYSAGNQDLGFLGGAFLMIAIPVVILVGVVLGVVALFADGANRGQPRRTEASASDGVSE